MSERQQKVREVELAVLKAARGWWATRSGWDHMDSAEQDLWLAVVELARVQP